MTETLVVLGYDKPVQMIGTLYLLKHIIISIKVYRH